MTGVQTCALPIYHITLPFQLSIALRSVLDDLWIKDVNSIPEWTEQDILQMVRARKTVAPKKWMPN